MPKPRARFMLLIANPGVAAAIFSVFVWGLRGAHRFPTEAAVYVAILLVLLASNTVYLWRQPDASPD
jgi:hypothetical protein